MTCDRDGRGRKKNPPPSASGLGNDTTPAIFSKTLGLPPCVVTFRWPTEIGSKYRRCSTPIIFKEPHVVSEDIDVAKRMIESIEPKQKD